jgi:peptide/nickel transport system substrate-binding protein
MNTAKPPFDDINCRLAATNAFDYDAAIKMVAVTDKIAQASPSTGALPVGMLGALPASNAYHRDLGAAKKYLSQCKYKPQDFTLELSWIGEVPIEERYALLMQSNFSDIGVKSEIKKVPWALFTEQVTKPENTPNISQVFVNAVTGDPDTLVYGMYDSSAAGTWQSPEYLKDAKVDEWLDKGRTAASDADRAAAYVELGKRLHELAPTIFAYDQIAVFAANERVSVPALSEPAKAFQLNGMGFTFRLMEMNE